MLFVIKCNELNLPKVLLVGDKKKYLRLQLVDNILKNYSALI